MKRPPHTVVYTHGGGRLGNQVVRFLHWMAWTRARAGEAEVLNLAFWPFADYFAQWRQHPGCVFPVRPSGADRLARWHAALPRWLRAAGERRTRLPRLVQAAGNWWPGWQAVGLDIVREEGADLGDPCFSARLTRGPVTTCCGWKIADWRLVEAHQAALRQFFQPAPEHERQARDFIAALRRDHELVFGLLIRQSDYQSWHDGRFCFSTEQYALWVRQLLALHPGRKVAVVVASEVRQDPARFAGLPVHFATGTLNAGGCWFESWVELSLCDLVVSPPSTFSATAAFLGAIPLWPLVAAGQDLACDQIIPDGLVGAARHPVFCLAVK